MSIKHSDNYYEILEQPFTYSQEEMNESYCKLSLKYHPKLASPTAVREFKFQQLAEAYELLSDQIIKEYLTYIVKMAYKIE